VKKRDVHRKVRATRATLALLVSALALVVAAATASARVPQPPSPATAGAAPDPFPEATGKTALLKVCSNCHTAETVIQTLRTRQEWADVLDQMSRFGAEASDQEFDQILAYLTRHFSPIRVNKATATELEAALDIPAAAAEAIVAYRVEKGEFKTVDDLKNVPGLEIAKVEAMKARIVF
jgi:competence protein ComEA